MASLSCQFHSTNLLNSKNVNSRRKRFIFCSPQPTQNNVKVVINGATKEIGRAAAVAVTKARGMEVAGAVDTCHVREDIGKIVFNSSRYVAWKSPLKIPIINDLTMILGSISQATAFGMRSVVYVPQIKLDTVAALSAFCEKANMVSTGASWLHQPVP